MGNVDDILYSPISSEDLELIPEPSVDKFLLACIKSEVYSAVRGWCRAREVNLELLRECIKDRLMWFHCNSHLSCFEVEVVYLGNYQIQVKTTFDPVGASTVYLDEIYDRRVMAMRSKIVNHLSTSTPAEY